MSDETKTPEPFSWSKFFSGFNTVVGWAKFASFWVKVAMVVIPIVTAAWFYHSVYQKGFNRGSAVMEKLKDEEFKRWVADHPQQTFTGENCTVNNNVQKPNNHFQMGIFPLRIGWCE